MLRQKRREAKKDTSGKSTISETPKDGVTDKRKYSTHGSRKSKSRRVTSSRNHHSTSLEEAVFGFDAASSAGTEATEDDMASEESGAEDDTKQASVVGANDAVLFFDDRGGEHEGSDEDDGISEESDDAATGPSNGAAWDDEDDERVAVNLAAQQRTRKLRKTEAETVVDGVQYAQKLKGQFEKVYGKPSWYQEHEEKSSKEDKKSKGMHKVAINSDSDGDSDEESGSDSEVAATSSNMLARGSRLPLGALDCTRVRDANVAAVSKSAVQAVGFHPTSTAMFTAGLDKTLRLFQVDGKVNTLLQSVHFPDLPINSAMFTKQGAEIALSGRRKFFYIYDLQSGRVRKIHEIQGRKEKSLEHMYASPDDKYLVFTGLDGDVLLVSNQTKHSVGHVKMNGSARAVSFLDDGNRMLTAGGEGKVYVWDLRHQRRCVHAFVDEGAVSCTTLSVAPNNAYVAVGQDTGVVNIYDGACLTERTPVPRKAVMNLTTGVHHMVFHPDAQMLAIGSRVKRDAFRLVHLPSCTVFKNWPAGGRGSLGYVNSFAFSPSGGYLTLGNDKGKAMLYRLNHYTQF